MRCTCAKLELLVIISRHLSLNILSRIFKAIYSYSAMVLYIFRKLFQEVFFQPIQILILGGLIAFDFLRQQWGRSVYYISECVITNINYIYKSRTVFEMVDCALVKDWSKTHKFKINIYDIEFREFVLSRIIVLCDCHRSKCPSQSQCVPQRNCFCD